MPEKNKIVVRIQNKEYTLMGLESEDYLQQVALYVDKKMAEVTKNSSSLSTNMISCLAAVNIADEYFKSAAETAWLKEQWEKSLAELAAANNIIKDYKSKNEALERIIEQPASDLPANEKVEHLTAQNQQLLNEVERLTKENSALKDAKKKLNNQLGMAKRRQN